MSTQDASSGAFAEHLFSCGSGGPAPPNRTQHVAWPTLPTPSNYSMN